MGGTKIKRKLKKCGVEYEIITFKLKNGAYE